ncbi:breast cancer type 2 susceptibility protein [Engraulis encrasicolus]|uniref:breast cancer type 2 susceptibility protein n=1 Tax=Engraulis encrasicolus TaxID=184585 RepID=UPI002FD74353
MFEAITLEIKRELGPLTPNWFEELTLRASRSDGKEVEVPECPCNEDVTFEPTDVDTKTTSANQISTPMPFLSPPTFLTEEQEQCPAAAHTSSLTDSSPYLFGSTRERGLPKSSIDINIAGGGDTPKRALFEAQRISESLGAQINPNLSWTSSFNTPSSLTPTVVLPKRPESSCTVKPTEEHIVFVRKLFPPAFADPQTSDDRLIIKQKNKPERSLNGDIDVSGVFNQSVPHTAEDDGEVPATVESVLDGSEDILSFLFTSRRTRATEPTRATRSPILKGSSQAAATHNVLDAQTKLDEQIDGPLKNRDSEVTQWTPLSLPECTGTSLDQGYFTVSSVTKKDSPQHTNGCEHDYATQGDGLQRSLGCMPKSRAELKWDAPPKCGSTPYALNASHMFRKPNTMPCSIKNSAQELCRPHHQPAAKRSHGGQVVASTQRESEEEKIISVPDRAKTLLDKSLEAGDQGGAHTASVQGPDLTLTGEDKNSSALPLCSANACSLLTASQRADVSELCNLLEEADSQCEFTQVKPTKVDPSKLVEAVRQSGNEEEWTKDVLITDCDFDDSFPTDIESGMTSSQVVQQAGDNSTPAAKNSTESSSDGRQMFVSAKHTGENETVSEERHSKRRKMSHCQSFEQLVPSGTRSALSNIAPYNARVQQPGLKRVNFSSAVKLSQEQDNMTNTSNCFEAITDEEMCVSTEVDQANLPVIDMPSRTYWGENEHVLKNYSRGNAGSLPYIKSEGLMNETDPIANGDIRFGFSTAGGKHVSKKALKKAHKLFEECDETPMEMNFDLKLGKGSISTDPEAKNTLNTNQIGDHKCAEDQLKRFGFSTAGGKEVSVSKKALQEAHKLFDKCDEMSTDIIQQMSSETANTRDRKHAEQPTGFGFSTAGGKHVSVSKKALQQSHKLFEKCDDEMPMNGNFDLKLGKTCSSTDSEAKNTTGVGDQKHAQQSFSSFGLSTAGGKDVHVSRNDLKAAHKLFEKCDDTPTETTKHEDQKYGHNKPLGNVGFSTAGGKEVSVSKKALQQAHKLFEKCDETPVKNNPDGKLGKACISMGPEARNTLNTRDRKHAEQPTGFGFSTAGGKGVSVSKKALQQAHKLFETCDEMSTDTIQQKDPKHGGHSLGSFGFSTAGGKEVSVSKKALQQALKLFETCDDEAPMKINSDLKLSKPCSSTDSETNNTTGIGDQKHAQGSFTSFGFSTAGGKDVHVSRNALKAAHKLFEKCDDTPTETTQHEDQKYGHKNPLGNFGSSTAGGKDVSVSKKALQQAHKLFEMCDDEMPMSKNSSSDPEAKNTLNRIQTGDQKQAEESLTSFGFSTAGGKGVSVSKKALQQAHKLFETCDETPMKSHSDLKLSKPCISTDPETKHTLNTTGIGGRKHAEESLTSFGFSTAGGKNVSVSKKALQQAHKLFEKCDEMSTDTIQQKDPKYGEPSLQSFGFSTAGGKDVSVSKKALQQAHKLFEKCDEMSTDTANQEDQKPGAHSLGSFGFSTAGGKDVSVSKKALQEAHKLFETCDETPMKSISDLKLPKPCSSTDPETKSTHFGFSTARGKEVSVSKKALQEAQKLFEKFDEMSNETARQDDQKPGGHSLGNFGFSTAGGKDVSVSKKSLQEAHKLFETCDDVSTLTTQQEDINPGDHSLATSGFGTAGSKDEPVCEEACKRFEKSNVRPADRRQYISSEKTCLSSIQSPVDYPTSTHQSNQYNARIEKQPVAESVGLSVGLSSYTDPRRQRYFEQEAIACAEALLEDDRLQKCALLGPSQPRQMGNRTVDLEYCSEDTPPQRRDSKSSRRFLVPMTSSPSGALSDRKVKRNVLLQANTSHPHRTTVAPRKQSEGPVPPTVESSSGKRSVEGVPAFVPPYRKQANVEQQNTAAKSVAQAAVPEIKMEVNGVQTSVCPAAEPGGPQIYNKTTCHSETRVRDNLIPIDSQHNIPQDKDTNDSNHRSELLFDDESPNTHVDMDVLTSSTISEKALECMCLARDMQDLRIRKKNIQSVRPLPGSVFLTKTSGSPRISIQAAVGYTCPQQHPKESLYLSGVRSEVCQVSGRSAQVFQFQWEHHFKVELLCQGGGVQLADGGWLIPDAQGRMGKEQFYRALCDTPGVDPRLISEEWVYNHYRWILWKRAAMERAFPREFGGLCLGPEQVLLQLKYRYDVEVDKSQRSALRRIIERDDTPSKTLVLCVCDIDTSSQTTTPGTGGKAGLPTTVWLTDGWYSVRAQLDPPLAALVQRGRVRVGMKLVTHGAELVGPQDACHPLEAPETLMLKISANSTRPARWHAKLGYHRDPRPYRVPLASLFSDGGVVSCIDFLVLRSYPIQWMEKTGAGAFIFRSERAEEREARLHEERKQKAMDTLFTGIQAAVEKEEEQDRRKRRGHKKRLSDQELRALRDGEELHEAVESDPTLQGSLCDEQRASLLSFRQSLTEKRQMRLQERCRRALREAQEQADGGVPSREATPVWKLAVCDANEPGDLTNKDSIFQLNIWRPSMDLRSLLREGGRYVGYNLSTSEGKRKTTANVQLTATKKTRFENGKVVPELLVECFQSRQCISFSSLQSPSFRSLCGEVDVMGYIIHIADQNGPSPVMYLADEGMAFVSVRFPSSLRQLAVEELAKPRGFLIVSNALLRQASAPIPSLSAGEFTVLKTSSVEHQIQEQLKQLKSSIQSQEHFFKDAEEKLLSLVHTPSQPGSRTPKQSFYSDAAAKGQSFYFDDVAAAAASGVKRTPQASCASEGNNPKSLKRKRGLDYLSRIPSPPPLRPLLAPGTSSSVHVKKVFNPPRRSERLSTGGNIIQTPLLPRATVAPASASTAGEEEWVKDEELALIHM